MSSVGIITIVKVNNYGAELQAFALQKKIQQLGFDCELIDYLYYKNWRFKDSEISRPFVPMSRKGKLIYWLKYRLVNFFMDSFGMAIPAVKKRCQRFSLFHKKNTRFSRKYRSMDALYKNVPRYDVYMVGSDQVWNPSASSSIEPYFLTFAPTGSKTVSYASSFGVGEIDSSLCDRYKMLLNNIGTISVREQSGVDIVKKITGRDAQLVVDPTLLLDGSDWEQYMNPYPNMPAKYILVYQLTESTSLLPFAKAIAKECGLPVYQIAKRAYGLTHDKDVIYIPDAGPAEFLSLISGAACVVTNSFHGTAFSVNFHTPFYAVLNRNRGGNARITSLLSQLGLVARIVYEDDVHTRNILPLPDYGAKLDGLRSSSVDFLHQSIC